MIVSPCKNLPFTALERKIADQPPKKFSNPLIYLFKLCIMYVVYVYCLHFTLLNSL